MEGIRLFIAMPGALNGIAPWSTDEAIWPYRHERKHKGRKMSDIYVCGPALYRRSKSRPTTSATLYGNLAIELDVM